MNNREYEVETIRTARLAGLSYLGLAIFGAFSIMYVPKVIAKDLAITTMQSIVSHETIFRLGILSNGLGQLFFLFTALFLYKLFQPVDKLQSRFLIASVLIAIPAQFVNISLSIGQLMIARAALVDQLLSPEVASGLVDTLAQWSAAGEDLIGLLWGLWLVPFGILVWKSEFIPRLFGVLLLVNAFGYFIDSTLAIVSPDIRKIAADKFLYLLSVGKIPILIWLVISGARFSRGSTSIEEQSSIQ